MDIIKSIRSFKYAFKGLWLLVTRENNARVHFLATSVVVALCLFLGLEQWEWLWVLVAITMVWIMEAFNTAIEIITDKICPDFDEQAGQIKDIAAGAVLLAAMFAVVVAVFILVPKVFALL